MIRATVGILASSAGGFDSDYQAVLDYATTQTYTLPSESQQELQNQLVKDLKSAGVWSNLDLFYVFATDGDREYAAINWKDVNNHEIVEYNSPTFTTDIGFTGNGSSSYLDTGTSLDAGTNFDPSTSLASFGAWSYYTKLGGGDAICGANNNINRIRGGFVRIIGEGNVPTLSSGFYHMNANGSNTNLFLNGVTDITEVLNNQTDSSNFYGLRDSAAYGGDTCSILFSGGDLSSEQSDFYTAVNSYMTSI